MRVDFFGCVGCGKIYERRALVEAIRCSCGNSRFSPVFLNMLRLIWYVLKHPSLLIMALREEQ